MGEAILTQLPEVDELRHGCGVVGIFEPITEQTDRNPDLAARAYQALLALQNRGQEGAGLYLWAGGHFVGEKSEGLVHRTITQGGRVLDRLAPQSQVAVGQTRYGTSGHANDKMACAQPFTRESARGQFVFAQNGNEAGIDLLAQEYGVSPDAYVTDSDCIALLLSEISYKHADSADPLLEAIYELTPKLHGAYSMMIAESDRLIAARDPRGFRPLFWGTTEQGGHMFTSELPALEAAGGKLIREVESGEIIVVNEDGVSSLRVNKEVDGPKPCALEYVYFMDPRGRWNGRDIYQARKAMGEKLGARWTGEADIVIGVPDSGTPAALGFAKAAGLPFEQGLRRNPYAGGRTFIQGNQDARSALVLEKLQPMPSVLEGQRVIVVDDSIIRGTNMRTLVKILRDAGAREVHLRITLPRYLYPCFFGIDTGNPTQLLARKFATVEEMRDYLGSDSLEFSEVEELAESIGRPVGALCMACMTGEYTPETPRQVLLGIPPIPWATKDARGRNVA